MAITNHERVGKGLELLKSGLGPFIEREFKSAYKDRAAAEASRFMGEDRLNAKRPVADWDVAALLKLMWESWNDVFRKTLAPAEREKQAETQKSAADGAVTARLPETYQWLLVPVQSSPQAVVEWQSIRLSGQDGLALRASKKLRSDELLVTGFAATRLRMELDRVPLWRGDHVAIKQLVEDFARYLYLPRLREPPVLVEAIREGLRLLTWSQDSFAYAESFDDVAGRYRGLRCGQMVNISADNLTGLLVRPEVALKQYQAETTPPPDEPNDTDESKDKPPPPREKEVRRPKRFHGSVSLDPARVGRDAGRVRRRIGLEARPRMPRNPLRRLVPAQACKGAREAPARRPTSIVIFANAAHRQTFSRPRGRIR